MLAIRRAILLSSIFILGLGTSACAQTRPKAEQEKAKQEEPKFEVNVSAATGKEAERRLRENEGAGDLRRKFTATDDKCRELLKARMYEGAESACRSAAELAEQLDAPNELERSGAYEALGLVLAARERYPEALDYFSRALDSARPRLTETSAELARLHGNLAMTQHMLGDLGKALELYRESEKVYRAAYDEFGKDGSDDPWVQRTRAGYLDSLKMILKLHRNAAEAAGAAAEVEEIEKQLKSLP